MVSQMLIGTHNGNFHCDEVFACYMLKKLPMFVNHSIVRTRDPEMLKQCDIVVDVGGVYDHPKKRYDHHQRDFAESMHSVTRLHSAGLIYAHYGKSVIANILNLAEDDADMDRLYEHVYRKFVEGVDAIDNGIKQYDGTPRYQMSSTLDSRVRNCNPAWNDQKPDPEKGFHNAMAIVGAEFEERIRYLNNAWIPARNIVVEAIERRTEAHPSGRIILFPKSGSVPPWKEHFFQLENELGLENVGICLVVFADSANNTWRVQAIPVSDVSSFDNRVSIPWKGHRDDQLERESGIAGAIFVHANGFIGGTKSLEGAMRMAEETLKMN
ncbi:hypothetical protein niasHT_010319 [Heterodera trifolii]|uniref:Uncharacterized protein n=1 Tax=Heterodera trifolii TaxID=157864 RepID=A0ABD2M927_9BILA